jgi:hypothetical protein
MSHLRKVALLVALAVLGLGTFHSSPTAASGLAPSFPEGDTVAGAWTLVKADWCEDICAANCSECFTAYVEHCTCYWFCTDGEDGRQICTGDIGVKICG